MQPVTRLSQPDIWIDQIFSAKAVQKGAVIRRSIPWIEREIGRERFVEEVRRRGFHLIETAGQFVVICHGGAIRILF